MKLKSHFLKKYLCFILKNRPSLRHLEEEGGQRGVVLWQQNNSYLNQVSAWVLAYFPNTSYSLYQLHHNWNKLLDEEKIRKI